MANGKVYLIGAGPGDIELLTLKAVRALAQADVILLDNLVNPEVLQFARPGVSVIHVGKRGGCKSTPQPFISKLMISLAKEGKCVARVKGGDPLVFARTGEELEKLAQAQIAVTIVSGITAGLAAPAALGIPLTHRQFAHSITFVTGSCADVGQPNWQALVESGSTLVIYMAMRNLATIAKRLIAAGMAPSCACAVIENATTSKQRWLLTNISQLPGKAKKSKLTSPAIVVVGKVIELAHLLALGENTLFNAGGF
jgi:uroporphyrin-III C-methyltransferase